MRIGDRLRLLLPALAATAALGLLGWGAIRATASPSPDQVVDVADFEEVGRSVLRPDADGSTLPIRVDGATWRVVVEGEWAFSHTGETLPAAALIEGLEFPGGRRPLIRVTPQPREIIRTAGGVVLVPPDMLDGESMRFLIDTDPLVDTYLLAPSKARAALSGGLTITLRRLPVAPVGLAAGGAQLGAGALLLLISTGFVGLELRRRSDTPARLLLDEIRRRVRAVEERLGADPDEASTYLTRVLTASARAASELAADLDRHGSLADIDADHPALAGLQRIIEVVRGVAKQLRVGTVKRSGRSLDLALVEADRAREELAIAARAVSGAAAELERMEDLGRGIRPPSRTAEGP
jgi:hypothetical protein